MRCSKNRSNGQPCQGQAISGTDACRVHSGRPLDEHKARGAVVVELSKWGITDRTLDPGITLLQLMTQAFYRAQLYSDLLEQAYEAAERLAHAAGEVPPGYTSMDGPAVDQVPGQRPNSADLDRAQQDLDRIFQTGGVAALIGNTYAAAGKDGNIYATGEAIRGLVQLEAQERDRAAGMAAKAVAAGLATRQVELAERQGALVASLIQRLFADPELGLTPEQAARAPQVAARHLRALGAAEGTTA